MPTKGRKVMAVPVSLNGAVLELGKAVEAPARRFSLLPSRGDGRTLFDALVKPPPAVSVLLNWKPR